MVSSKHYSLLSLLAAAGQCSPASRSSGLVSRAVTIPQGAKWQIEINDPIDFSGSGAIAPADAKVWDIDFWYGTDKGSDGKTVIQKLRERNGQDIIVVCYFNAGGVQEFDEDFSSFKGYTYEGIGDWEGEYYVDVSAQPVVDLFLKRIQRGLDGGCDAFDPDNVDAYGQGYTSKDGKTKLNEDAYVAFLGKLAAPVHAAGKLLGQKNAGELTDKLLAGGITDFAVLEGCLEDDFCEDFVETYGEAGKAVLQIEYPQSVQPKSDDDDAVCPKNAASAADFKKICGSPPKGFSTVIKQDGNSCGLNGFVEYCDGTVVITPTEQ